MWDLVIRRIMLTNLIAGAKLRSVSKALAFPFRWRFSPCLGRSASFRRFPAINSLGEGGRGGPSGTGGTGAEGSMGQKPSWFLLATINVNFLHSRLSTFLPTASFSSASPATPQFNSLPSPPLPHAEIHQNKLYFPRSMVECLASCLRLVLPPRAQPDPALAASPAPILQRLRPRRISSERGCAVPLFRPYVASVPWHGGVRGFLSQLFPRYGHYCGPNWSSGKDGGSMLWDQRPVDWLDFCCYCHDIGYDTYDQAKLVKADLAFLECLEQPRMASKGGGAPAAIIYRAMCIAGLRTILIPYRMHLVRLQSGPSFLDAFNNLINKSSSSTNNEATKCKEML